MIPEHVAPGFVVSRDEDEARSLCLLGLDALAADTPGIREHLCKHRVVALISSDHLAADCYALGATEVWLVHIPPSFHSLRDYLHLHALPEDKQDQAKSDSAARWRELLDRAQLLEPGDYPCAPDLSTATGILDASIEPLPTDTLPAALGAIVQQGARAQGVDLAMWGAPMLSCIAGAIGNRFWLEVKPGFVEKPIVWSVIVGPSGAGKSPPLRTLLQPHKDYDCELTHASAQARRAHRDKHASAEKSGSASPGSPPPLAALLVDDITIEALATRLADNPKGLLLYRDELAGWLRSMNAYRGGRGGDEARWLSLYDGDQIKVDRKTGDQQTLVVPRPAVSLVGTVQLGTLRQLLNANMMDSGFGARLLLSCPQPTFPDWSESELSQQTLDAYAAVVRSILTLAHSEPKILQLDLRAKAVWKRFYNWVTKRIRQLPPADEHARAGLVKLRSACLRIAICLQVARQAEEAPHQLGELAVVTEQTLSDAVRLTRWFMAQQKILYAHLRIGSDEPNNLCELIRAHGGLITVRDLQRATRRFRTSEEAKRALENLAFKSLGRWRTRHAPNGRQMRTFELIEAADPDADAHEAS